MQIAAPARALLALALIASFPATAVHAVEPADYVSTPIVEEGEREIEFKGGISRNHDGSSESQHSLGLGYGVNARWFTEVYAKWHHEVGAPAGFDAWEWENKLQLTETGRYPVDLGVLLEIERPQNRDEGYELRYGPLLQTESGALQANLNLLFTKHVRASEPSDTQFGYQWQLKYAWQPALDFGVQGFGSTGPWDHWDDSSSQQHVLGPALFGKLKTGPHQAIKYDAALLFGINDASPRATLRLRAEYEF